MLKLETYDQIILTKYLYIYCKLSFVESYLYAAEKKII